MSLPPLPQADPETGLSTSTGLVNKLPKGWVLDNVVAVNPRGEMAVAGCDARGGEVALELVPLL